MSLKRVRTSLKWDGPFFPKEIDELNKVYGKRAIDRFTMQKIGEATTGFENTDHPITNDGYDWFWGLYFKTAKGKGRIATLFPWVRDNNKKDGSRLDRSITVYAQGKVNPQEIKALIKKLCVGLEKLPDVERA